MRPVDCPLFVVILSSEQLSIAYVSHWGLPSARGERKSAGDAVLRPAPPHPGGGLAAGGSLARLVVLGGLLADGLGAHVGGHGEDHHHDGQEGRDLELLVEHREEHLHEVDHEDGGGLADVLQHGVKDGEEVHGAPALDGEGGEDAVGGVVPAVEEAVLPGVAREGDRQDGHEPGQLELHQLHVDGLVLEVLHVLVGQDGAEAGDRHLQQHVHDAHEGDAAGAVAGGAAADHVHAHGEHHQGEDVPLQAALLGALDGPHHERRDEELGLQEHLVGGAAEGAHARHLEVVAERVEEADEGEDLHRRRLPDGLPLSHA